MASRTVTPTTKTPLDNNLHSPPTVHNKLIQQPKLVTCLKRSGSRERRRLIRRLWSPSCSCLVSYFHNDSMFNVMSFLSMKDLIMASRVCRRWKHCAMHENLREYVDATDFVHATFQQCVTAKHDDPRQATSQSLQHYLEPYTASIKSLTIRSIEHRLCACRP